MTLKHLLAAGAMAALMVGATAAQAQNAGGTVIGSETDGGGFVGSLFGPNADFGYNVASDGEAAFDPFGAGHDTSDGLNFSSVGFTWLQADDSHWESLGNQTWDLPADLGPCGVENNVICEPVGHFISPGAPWNPGFTGTWLILDSNGALSDKIVTFNTNVGAELRFFSDPTFSIPEPSTWAMMLIGFFGLGTMVRSRKAAVA
jgi:hypothetical protein